MWIASALFFAGELHAQTSAAQITGRVTDQAGANVTGADIQVTNTDTGIVRPTKTADTGYYTVPLLPPGPTKYRLRRLGSAP